MSFKLFRKIFFSLTEYKTASCISQPNDNISTISNTCSSIQDTTTNITDQDDSDLNSASHLHQKRKNQIGNLGFTQNEVILDTNKGDIDFTELEQKCGEGHGMELNGDPILGGRNQPSELGIAFANMLLRKYQMILDPEEREDEQFTIILVSRIYTEPVDVINGLSYALEAQEPRVQKWVHDHKIIMDVEHVNKLGQDCQTNRRKRKTRTRVIVKSDLIEPVVENLPPEIPIKESNPSYHNPNFQSNSSGVGTGSMNSNSAIVNSNSHSENPFKNPNLRSISTVPQQNSAIKNCDPQYSTLPLRVLSSCTTEL